MAHDIWLRISGSKYLAHDIWPTVHGSLYLAQNIWPTISGSRYLAHDIWPTTRYGDHFSDADSGTRMTSPPLKATLPIRISLWSKPYVLNSACTMHYLEYNVMHNVSPNHISNKGAGQRASDFLTLEGIEHIYSVVLTWSFNPFH